MKFEKFFRTPLLKSASGKILISCTSCRISTRRYRKKLFQRCFSSILHKNEKQPFEGIYLLKIPKFIWEVVIPNDVARCKFTKKTLSHPPLCILPSFYQSTSRLLPPRRLKRLWKYASTISFKKIISEKECRRQSPRGVLWKRFLRNFAKLTGKCLCQNLFFNKVAASGLQLY